LGLEGKKDVYLRDLAVFASGLGASNRYTKTFDLSTHIMVEPVLAWIQRNKGMLDDLVKLNVAAGDAGVPIQ
jgi:hypothetical protein